MAKRQPFTFENNFDKIVAKIQEKPNKVLATIGANLVKEVKATTLKTQFHRRRGILKKSLQWAYGYDQRLQKKDKTSLQIGFKMSIPGIVGAMISRQEEDPIGPVVKQNAGMMQDLIAKALDEIGRE